MTERANSNETAEGYPIGTVLFPTAVAYVPWFGGIFVNRDMLPGPPPGGTPWVWGLRVTKQGSNGWRHEPDWLQFQQSRGTACSTFGPINDNCTATWVRVESVDDAMRKGPDAYGYSR